MIHKLRLVGIDPKQQLKNFLELMDRDGIQIVTTDPAARLILVELTTISLQVTFTTTRPVTDYELLDLSEKFYTLSCYLNSQDTPRSESHKRAYAQGQVLVNQIDEVVRELEAQVK